MKSLWLPFGLALVACTGTDTGNPYQQTVVVDAHSSNTPEIAVAVDDGGAVVTRAWLSIDDLSLYHADVCGDTRALVPTASAADHAEPAALTVSASLEAAEYCRLSLPFVAATAAQNPDLAGLSIVIEGTTAAGTPFELTSDIEITVEFEPPSDAISLSPSFGGLFVGFDVASWFEGIDLDAGALTGSDLIIDSTSNSAILDVFENNLGSGVELYRDSNENGQLEAEDELLASGT